MVTITQSHELPSIETLSPNLTYVTVGNMSLWYSYRTIIAFSSPETGLVVRENVWGTTTGKHLNTVSRDKKIRVNGEKFAELMQSVLS